MQLHVRMAPRDPGEAHRASTPLELFFDLAFVVAVAQAAGSLHHGLVEGHTADALLGFPLVFFAIWWAWMNFAWFASAFDCDDALYRLAVFVQMTGVLILAAGIPRAFDDRDFAVMTLGYVVMRLAMVAQWLRAAASYPAGRRTAVRYAIGITVVQIGWLLRLLVPEDWFLPTFLVLALAEMVVPVWAEAAGRTPWHPRHMVERYALFTIIVLGESVLAATVAVQAALDADSTFVELAAVVGGGLLIVFSMWSVYFEMPADRVLERARDEFDLHPATSFVWGYGHYLIFGAAAAAGAGLAVAVDHAADHSELSDVGAGLAVTVPVAVYLLVVWALHYSAKAPGPLRVYAVPVVAAAVLVSSVTPEPVLITGVLLAGLVGVATVVNRDDAVPVDDAVSSGH